MPRELKSSSPTVFIRSLNLQILHLISAGKASNQILVIHIIHESCSSVGKHGRALRSGHRCYDCVKVATFSFCIWGCFCLFLTLIIVLKSTPASRRGRRLVMLGRRRPFWRYEGVSVNLIEIGSQRSAQIEGTGSWCCKRRNLERRKLAKT